jgi:Holliday junction resolvasome RuvABC endonuclease subunit
MIRKKPTQRIIKIPRRRIKTSNYSVLGLDCSSKTIGWGLVVSNKEPTLVAYGHFKPLGPKHPMIVRLDGVYKKIIELCNELKPTCVAVEDIITFMKGKSTAQTVTVLTAFNRVASLAGYHDSKGVDFYSVHQVRKIIKMMNPDIKNTISKEDMPDIIIKHLEPQFEKMFKKTGDEAEETCDEADGIAVGWAHILHQQNHNLIDPILIKPKKKRKKRKKGKKNEKSI